jgi:tellurite resistance protein
MPDRQALSPMFTEIALSADDAEAIVAALRDVAETDGVHDEELALIQSFVETLDEDLGEPQPTKLETMTPEELARRILDPTVRTIAVQVCVLLAMADGAISDKERARVKAYAEALDLASEYPAIEKHITDWVKSGDAAPMFD